MAYLLQDGTEESQQLSYAIIKTAAHRRTEHLVIEAAVNTDESATYELPNELLCILQKSSTLEPSRTHSDKVCREFYLTKTGLNNSIQFGYLLGWMAVFDSFSSAVRLCCKLSRYTWVELSK